MKELFLKYIGLIAGLIVIGFMVWYFSGIVTYIAVALLLSFMGSPLVRRLRKVHIGRFILPKAVCASITLLVMIMIFGIFVLIVVPLIIQQANVIASIDVEKLVAHYKEPMERLNEFLIQYNVLGSEETIANYIENQITSLMDLTKFTNFFANLVTATGSVFMGTFIILFLTFYFLLDENLVKNFILLLTPDEHMQSIEHVLHDSKILLVRYFHGILLEIVIMMTESITRQYF